MGEKLKRFFMYLLSPLLNERGETGEDDEKTETDEELETSEDEDVEGEEEDVESDKDEDAADESDTALKESDEDEDPPKDVPYERFKEVNEKLQVAGNAQEKLDQFKQLGPEGYYKLYPDEKPAEEKSEDESGGDDGGIKSMSEMAGYQVQGGEYDGKTLQEVYDEKPLAALDIYNNYKKSVEEQAGKQAQSLADSEKEIEAFATARSKDAFNKDYKDLAEDESKQIESLVDEVTNWMVETKRGGGIIEDAFFLMHKEGLFEKTKSDTVKALVKILNDPGTTTISSKKTTPSEGGYERFSSYSPQQAADELEKFTDKEQTEFLKKAPKSVRTKHPDLPWA